MNPEHLLEQAEALLGLPRGGAPRQADKRRAVSSSYYAVFHAIARAAASEFVGGVHWRTPRYTLVYRSVAHGRIKAVCQLVQQRTAGAAYRPYWPAEGFSEHIRAFATLYLSLLKARHSADYDPRERITAEKTRERIAEARSAIQRLFALGAAERELFLTLLLCEPRA